MLTSLLKATSRTFYQTLRVLPGAIRTQISLAYLLARATDTIADTEIVPVAQRLAALESLRGRILGMAEGPLRFEEMARNQGSAAERALLERCDDAVGLLDELSPADRQRVQQVLEVITSGQELDLRRFGAASAESIVALQSGAELDDYTYRVAGCVGEFWTRMCLAHVLKRCKLDEPALLASGIRFGKGLQLVNILRDLPADLRQGRCYLPREELDGAGLTPADLLKAEAVDRLRPLYDRHLAVAEAHLKAGWDYTNALPRRFLRLRLACAWPILIGVKTIGKLKTDNVLDPAKRVKISRREVKGIIWGSVLRYPSRMAWTRQFELALGEAKPVALKNNLQ